MAQHMEHITPEELVQYGVMSAPDILKGTPQENKLVFDRLVAAMVAPKVNAIIDVANVLVDAEDVRTEQEAQRVAAEVLRVAAEEARVAVEAARVQAETARANAEQGRGDTEALRVAAETERVNVEAQRVAAEVLRVAAENARVTAENGRVAAEQGRATAEGQRGTAEGQRADAETKRAGFELARALAEEARVQVETARVQAESQRATQEESRQTGEAARNTAEGLRADGEQARAAAEETRETRENTRQTQESGRQSAESGREAAEWERVAQESARNLWEDYDPAKGYVVGNKVAFNGSSYLCVTACTGKAPTDTAYWLLIAAKGVDGEGAGDMLASTYDPTGKQRDVFAFAQEQGEAAKTAAAQDATTKADAAKAEAISTAATDATTKANQAEANAKAASRPVAWMPSAQDVGADPAGSAGAVDGKLTTHTNDTTKHITAAERTKWNGKAGIFGPVTVSVPVGSWAGAGPWTQTVSVAGVTAADNGLTVCPVDIADNTAREAYKKAYACLAVEAETVAGGIKLTCRDGKPETTFNIVVKGVR